MSYRHWAALILLIYSVALQAATEEKPDDELLEFLGSFESSDGSWIDPADFEVSLNDYRVAERGDDKDE